MNNVSDFDYLMDYDAQVDADEEAKARLYPQAAPGQASIHVASYYAAKFTREAQRRPGEWNILPSGKGYGYVVHHRPRKVRA